MHRNLSLVLFATMNVLAFRTLPAQESAAPSGPVEAASLIKANLINLQSISSFDVLIETSDLVELENGEILEVKMRERWVRDEPNNRSLLVRAGERRAFLSKQKVATSPKIINVGLELNGRLEIREFPKPAMKQQCPPGTQFEQMLVTPDLRLISLGRYPAPTFDDKWVEVFCVS